MPLSSEIIKERLRMTFGSESQEVVAGKLNMSQGNVSKLLSGSQMPALLDCLQILTFPLEIVSYIRKLNKRQL